MNKEQTQNPGSAVSYGGHGQEHRPLPRTVYTPDTGLKYPRALVTGLEEFF